MRKYLMESGWVQKTVRIKDDYNKLCTFLEFYAIKMGKDVKKIYNEAYLFSLDHLIRHGFNYKFIPYGGRREPKGFLLEQTTLGDISQAFEQYSKASLKFDNKKLLAAEFYELLLYIYCMNMDEENLKYLNQSLNIDWGIEKVR